MYIAFRVQCEKCKKFWWAIINQNPCYDTCSYCDTEHKVSVRVEMEEAI